MDELQIQRIFWAQGKKSTYEVQFVLLVFENFEPNAVNTFKLTNDVEI